MDRPITFQVLTSLYKSLLCAPDKMVMTGESKGFQKTFYLVCQLKVVVPDLA